MKKFRTRPNVNFVTPNRDFLQRKLSLKTAIKKGLRYLAPCWFAFVLMILLMGYAHADEVIMKNGDRLQGEVVSMEGGNLIFKTPYASKNVIPWDQVERLTSEKILEISLPDKETLKGKVVIAEDGTLILQPETGPATEHIPMGEVKAMAPPKPPPEWEFSSRASVGINIEQGNTEKRTFQGDLNLELKKYPHRFTFYGELNKEKAGDPSVDTENNALANFDYNRFVSEKWYLFGNTMAQQDKFADLDLLWAVAAGAGYQFWHSKRKNLTLKIGPSYVSENYSKPMVNMDNKDYRKYAAGFWAIDFDMWFFERFLQVFHHDDGYVSFEDTNVWRLRTRTGIRIPITHGFFTSLQYNYDYVSSPSEGTLNYDSKLLFKLGWGL
jgi:putative salt-induced outer membrane protein YdiY